MTNEDLIKRLRGLRVDGVPLDVTMGQAADEIERLNNALRGFLPANHPAAQAHEPGVVYRKWPGDPPHCMSCDCGMTEEQKKTVPFEDYQRIHKELMDLKYPGSSPEPASRKLPPRDYDIESHQGLYTEPASREASGHRFTDAAGFTYLRHEAHCAAMQLGAGLLTECDCGARSTEKSTVVPTCGICGKPGVTEFVRTCCAEGRARDLAAGRTAARTGAVT